MSAMCTTMFEFLTLEAVDSPEARRVVFHILRRVFLYSEDYSRLANFLLIWKKLNIMQDSTLLKYWVLEKVRAGFSKPLFIRRFRVSLAFL